MWTPRPSGIASITFLAKATSAGSGEKTFFAMSICTGCGEQAVDVMDVLRALDLGDHDHVETVTDLADELCEVVEDPGRLERVDACPQRRVAELHLGADLPQARTGCLLAVDGHRVLEVAE